MADSNLSERDGPGHLRQVVSFLLVAITASGLAPGGTSVARPLDLPPGCTGYSGWALGPPHEAPEQALECFLYPDSVVVQLLVVTSRDSSGAARMRTLDRLRLPAAGESLQWSFRGLCGSYRNGREDRTVFGLARIGAPEESLTVVRAWEADRKQEKIVEIDPASIRCRCRPYPEERPRR